MERATNEEDRPSIFLVFSFSLSLRVPDGEELRAPHVAGGRCARASAGGGRRHVLRRRHGEAGRCGFVWRNFCHTVGEWSRQRKKIIAIVLSLLEVEPSHSIGILSHRQKQLPSVSFGLPFLRAVRSHLIREMSKPAAAAEQVTVKIPEQQSAAAGAPSSSALPTSTPPAGAPPSATGPPPPPPPGSYVAGPPPQYPPPAGGPQQYPPFPPPPPPSTIPPRPLPSPEASAALTCVSILWVFLLPPVGVALRGAPCSVVLLNLLLTMLGWFPGVIHALCVIGLIGKASRKGCGETGKGERTSVAKEKKKTSLFSPRSSFSFKQTNKNTGGAEEAAWVRD